MSSIQDLDQQLFLLLNGFHAPWLDPVMLMLTKTEVWIPLYVILAWLIFKKLGRKGWLVLAGAGLAILLADRITTGLIKPYFMRLRPSHEPALQSLTHIVSNYRGGLYGFVSSHAANTAAIALLMWLVFKDQYRWIGLLFLWAAFMSYSRIYLGVHYPGDILGGILIGLPCGWLGYRFYGWLALKLDKKEGGRPNQS